MSDTLKFDLYDPLNSRLQPARAFTLDETVQALSGIYAEYNRVSGEVEAAAAELEEAQTMDTHTSNILKTEAAKIAEEHLRENPDGIFKSGKGNDALRDAYLRQAIGDVYAARSLALQRLSAAHYGFQIANRAHTKLTMQSNILIAIAGALKK